MWVIYIWYVAASVLNSLRWATSLSDSSITLDFNRGRTELDFFPLCGTYILTVAYLRKSGVRTEAVRCRYCKGKTHEQPWKLSSPSLFLHSWTVCLTPRTRLFPAASQYFPPFYRSLKASSIRTRQRFCFECLIRTGYTRCMICMKKATCFSSFCGNFAFWFFRYWNYKHMIIKTLILYFR